MENLDSLATLTKIYSKDNDDLIESIFGKDTIINHIEILFTNETVMVVSDIHEKEKIFKALVFSMEKIASNETSTYEKFRFSDIKKILN